MIDFKINFVSSVPLHRQVEEKLLKAIEKGDINRGTRLPPVTTLSKALSVSVVIIERAYRELTKSQILQFEKGSGYFVGEKTGFL